MNVSSSLRPSVCSAFHRLIDYAGLFPPSQLPLELAQREYRTARSGPQAWMLGRFIIPAAQLMESAQTLAGPFSVIADADFATLETLAALRRTGCPVEALEMPLRKNVSFDEVGDAIEHAKEAIVAGGLGDLPAFVEIPRSAHWPELVPRAMSAIADCALRAKLRCGGSSAGAFPTVDEVAEFIAHACKHGVAFKATAGLHHPVRHLDAETGFTMHGFLNILAAAALAPRIERDALVRVVAEEDANAFTFTHDSFSWRDEYLSLAELDAVRDEVFVSYGSCSFSEPVEDLTALGLLAAQ